MADRIDKTRDGETFLSRWSRRKHASTREAAAPPSVPASTATSASPATAAVPALEPAPVAALPPVESLTFDSDFAAFLRPGVDPTLRQSALRTLLRDPHFNVMDGLDVYIDDYTKASPLDASVVAGMVQARYIFAPPPTRVNAAGVVEDVPENEASAKDGASPEGGQSVEHEASEQHDRSLELEAPTEHGASLEHDASLEHEASFEHEASLEHDASPAAVTTASERALDAGRVAPGGVAPAAPATSPPGGPRDVALARAPIAGDDA